MIRRVRYLVSDIFFWLRSHPVRAGLGLLVVAAVGAGAALGIGELTDDDGTDPLTSPAPPVFILDDDEVEEPADLGFPAFATRNTTRVAGEDSVTTAAGVALATFPAAGAVPGPDAVTIVDSEDWAAGVAAASLVADPVGSPVLMSQAGEISDLTADAIEALAPDGGPGTGGKEAFVIGDAASPEGLSTTKLSGASSAATAAKIASHRAELAKEKPDHVLIATSDDPALAMPAAAWAARSGDPVLFSQANSVPEATLEALEGPLNKVPVYLLGGEEVISAAAEKRIARAAGAPVVRASTASEPVANAIEFARFADGDFGWDINDPGHGFVVANAARPADAAAAAPLSGSGTWGPLLLTDDAEAAPPELEGYLLDLKPGYETDPTRALYNHIWLIGDEDAVSVEVQVELDEISEVAPVESGQGNSLLGDEPKDGNRKPKSSRSSAQDD